MRLGWLGLAAIGWAACVVDDGPPTIRASDLRDRFYDVGEGMTPAEVRAQLGGLPVRKPGHPDAPFPTPLEAVELSAPDGAPVRLEVYVVATRPEKGCGGYRYDDRPVAYVYGRVAGTSWEFVEWRWERWGGSLDRLRALQDRAACPDASADAPP